jgi:hypothetical protein
MKYISKIESDLIFAEGITNSLIKIPASLVGQASRLLSGDRQAQVGQASRLLSGDRQDAYPTRS